MPAVPVHFTGNISPVYEQRRKTRWHPTQKPNIILFGIDSLRADHMSCYGYDRLTSPYLDRFAQQGVLFENTISAHIPTTSAYASMLTGMDVFSTQVVALRHQGRLRSEVEDTGGDSARQRVSHRLRRL